MHVIRSITLTFRGNDVMTTKRLKSNKNWQHSKTCLSNRRPLSYSYIILKEKTPTNLISHDGERKTSNWYDVRSSDVKEVSEDKKEEI